MAVKIVFRIQRYNWVCADCGEVSDSSLEVEVNTLTGGRWFDDGHRGTSTIDENIIEAVLCDRLDIDFRVLEGVRSARSQRRLDGQAFSARLDDDDRQLFDLALLPLGFEVVRESESFEVVR
jgi:hypothetical protein